MTRELIAILQNRGLYFSSTIRDLANSPCSDNNEFVLDLQEIKERHFGTKIPPSPPPKSFSGLYVTPSGELLFIYTMNYDQQSSGEDFIKKFSQQKILNKLESTIEILNDILSYYGHYESFEKFLVHRGSQRIKTIILQDLPVGEFLKLKLTFNDELNIGTNNAVADEILIMNCKEFQEYYC